MPHTYLLVLRPCGSAACSAIGCSADVRVLRLARRLWPTWLSPATIGLFLAAFAVLYALPLVGR